MDPWLQSVLTGAGSTPAPRYLAGDRVEVLRAARLPAVEEVLGAGVVERVTGEHPSQLYWVSGFMTARTARELRLIERGWR